MQLLLLLLIFPAFAFFGIQGYERFFSSEGALATVGDAKITRQDFETAQRQQSERLRQVLGDRFDSSMLETPQARQRILDSLIAQRALLIDAVDHRVVVPDSQLRSTIRATGLGGTEAGFDIERYRNALRARGQSEAGFEAEIRREIALQTMPEAIAQTIVVPASVVERVLGFAEQARELRQSIFAPDRFAKDIHPGDEQLSAWYERNASAFEEPEHATVNYVVLTAEAIARSIEVSPEDARSYYEQNKARFTTAEQRRASHILIRVDPDASPEQREAAREKAQAIERQLKEGADFATLARTESQDPGSANSGGDLGFFTRDMMVQPFADAAFALDVGQTSAVVPTEFGFHVIRVTDIRPATQKSFDSVRPEIESEIRAQLAAARYAEAADTFSNLVYEQPDSLEPAAKRFGLKIETAEVRRDGNPALPRENPMNDKRLLEALFRGESIETKNNTEAVEVGAGRLAAARIVEYHPSRRRPFDEVKDEVRKRLVAELAHERAVKAGESRLAQLRNGEGAKADDFGAPRTVRRSAPGDFPAAALEPVFRAPAEPLPSYVGVDLGEQGYAVYEIVRVTPPDEALVAQRRDAYRQQLSQAYSQQLLGDYVASVIADAEVVRYPERMGGNENR
ncbi:MAG: SurA N-terminal domain-containing protein [Burkholderiaceae bacterium]|nr:SurA N-terminal domain-containing protein [Burkholderiaceae bacterium]